MAVEMNRTTSISLPGEVAKDILQKTQESSAVMRLARKIELPGPQETRKPRGWATPKKSPSAAARLPQSR